ncbi:MAG: T9SS type A sorting domain-containing protein [Bacteroidetes bacterium]|nr:T9SS type A sorting domain-containing protein [Bacteroidota bacterium]
MNKIKYILFFVCIVLGLHNARAQYLGGQEDGYSSGYICASDLNGGAAALTLSAITGPSNFCNNNSERYRVTVATGAATSFTWTYPAGASTQSGGADGNITILFGTTSGNVQITATNGCGESDTEILAVTNVACSMFSGLDNDGYNSNYVCSSDLNGGAAPLTLNPLVGPSNFCNNNFENYSVAVATGAATSYSWSYPAGASIQSGGTNGTATILFGTTSGSVTVVASNGCGESQTEYIAVTNVACSMFSGLDNDGYHSDYVCASDLNGGAAPLTINPLVGPSNFCNNNFENYSVAVATGAATSYSWSYPTGASVLSGGTNGNATILFSTNSGSVTVVVSNGCGESQTEYIAVTNVACSMFSGLNNDGYTSGYICGSDLNGLTSGTLSIAALTGNGTVCDGDIGDYSSSITTGIATSYTWLLPTGASVLSGGTALNARILFATASGSVSVVAENGCGEIDTATVALTNNACSMYAGLNNDGFAIQPSCEITLNGGDAAALATYFTYSISCPGSGGTVLTFTPTGGKSFDYQETATSAFAYSGVYTSTMVSKTVTNGGTYDIEIKDATGCTDDVFNLITSATPTTIPSTSVTGSCFSPGANTWMYIIDATGKAIVAVDDNSTNIGIVTATVYIDASVGTFSNTAYLQRHFLIDTENALGGGGAGVRLYFTAAELTALQTAATTITTTNALDNVASIAALGATKYNGPTEDGTYDPSDNTSLVYIAQTGNGSQFGNNYIEFTVSSFSELWPHASTGGNSALPIELLYFIGINKGDYNLLEWSTATEINNDYYTVEKSVDAVNFETAGIVDSEGNTQGLTNYLFSDYNVMPGITYYRLKQTDYDGSYTYSKTIPINVDFENINSLKVFPNPLSHGQELNLYVNLSTQKPVNVRVTNMMGIIVFDGSVYLSDKNIGKIDIAKLPAGIYHVDVTSEKNYHGRQVITIH